MRNARHPNSWHRLRWVAHQVERPRLRPAWRFALRAAAVLACVAFFYGSHAAFRWYFWSQFEAEQAQRDAERVQAELAADMARQPPDGFDLEGCMVDHSFAQCEEWRQTYLKGERAETARREATNEADRRAERNGCLKISKECLENPLSKTCQ